MDELKTNDGVRCGLYGSWVNMPLNPSDEEIKTVKELLVDEICEVIRQLADRDDFFIRHDFPDGDMFRPIPYTSLGWKIMCPTLTGDSKE